MYESHPKKVFNRLGLGLLGLVLAMNIVAAIIMLIVKHFVPDLYAASWFMLVLNDFVELVIGLPIVCFILKTIPKQEAEKKEAKAFSLLYLIVFALVGVGLSDLLAIIVRLIVAAFAGQILVDNASSLMQTSGMIPVILLGVIVSPIIEEVIFRGMVFKKVEPFGSKFAIIFTTIMFAFIHGSYDQIIYVLPLGLILGYVRSRTGSVKHTIVMHIIFNALGIGLSYCPDMAVGAVTVFVVIFAIVMLIIWLSKKSYRNLQFYDGIYQKPTFKQVVFNPGMILYIVFCLLGVVLSLIPGLETDVQQTAQRITYLRFS